MPGHRASDGVTPAWLMGVEHPARRLVLRAL